MGNSDAVLASLAMRASGEQDGRQSEGDGITSVGHKKYYIDLVMTCLMSPNL